MTASRPIRLGILGSGKGSNYGAIQRAIDAGELDAEIAIVLSDVETAGILDLARRSGAPARFLPPGPFKTRLDEGAAARYVEALETAGAEWIALAGFMRMIKEPLLARFGGRILNIHPSLLPKFRGLAAWKQALEAGERETGCTVHLVDSGMDTGTILARRTVPILPGDTPESLHARIQIAEHALYPAVIAEIAAKRAIPSPPTPRPSGPSRWPR
jgi:phosphoribosylglycinamide formyltransferase-1